MSHARILADRRTGTWMPIGSLARGLLCASLAGAIAPAHTAAAAPAVRGPVPVLGIEGDTLVLRDAERLPDGSVIVAGARDGRAFASRVRASGVLEERFGRRGIWRSRTRGEAAGVRVVAVGRGAAARKTSNHRIALTLQRAGGAPVTVWLGADGRGKRAPVGRHTGTDPGAGGDSAPPCTDAAAFARGGWGVADVFAVGTGRCGALLAAGSKRMVVMQRSSGAGEVPELVTRTVASGNASQVAARCLNHLLLFGVTRAGGRAQLVVQAVRLPSARRAGRHVAASPTDHRAARSTDAGGPVCVARSA